MPSEHFEQPLRDWSARKHAILKAYLPTFCTVLSNRAGGPIWYVDGYAGAGVYQNKNNPSPGEPGSPVLAAQTARDLPYDVRCINVEEDDENFESLERETMPFSHVTNIHADFNNVVDNVLNTVARHPALFFLDPFGTKDLPMEGLVDRIAMRTRQMDILLRYATETVRRVAAAYEKDLSRQVAYAQTLNKWFRGTEWQQLLQRFPVGPERDQALLNYYMQQLVSISGGRLAYASSYPIRTIEGNVKYHLVFATGDRLGIKLMSDILYREETRFIEQQAEHKQKKHDLKLQGQMSLFEEPKPDPIALQQEQLDQIQATILQIAREGRTDWEFDGLRCELIINHGWFAHMSEKEFRAACKTLHTFGKIERLTLHNNAWGKGTHFRILPKS